MAAENRQLWSRLSNLTKISSDEPKEPLSPTSHQNLIRSKTFTQNNPNPKLREKFQNKEPEDLVVDVAKFAISESGGSGDSSEEMMKKFTEELLVLKQEASRQNTALNVTHEKLKGGRSLLVCKNCATNSKKSEVQPQTDVNLKQNDSEKKDETSKNPGFVDILLNTTDNIDFLETKRKADAINSNDRICPMCGRIYAKDMVFEEFMEHVETHFLENDDISLESLNVDEQFGYASNIIHNF